ncbi:MAG: hypothetical protein Q8M98_03960 [Candidatus Cloacimonadaceae bacterium]|nr:hypothetical protein [Candidatus Cloacimonadaceae bacterium]
MKEASKNEHLINHSFPVYKPDMDDLDDGEYKPLQMGTAALLKHKNLYYIVTAGHVLDIEDINHISIGEIDELQLDKCMVYYQHDEEIDAGVIKISKEQAEKITSEGKYMIDFDDQSKYIPKFRLEAGLITIVGYPGSEQELNDDEKKLKVVCKIITGPILSSNVLNSASKLVVQYDRMRLVRQGSDQLVIGPYPPGMSGSPVWFNIDEDSEIMEFAGIAIQYSEDRNLVVIIRAEVILQLLEEVEKEA